MGVCLCGSYEALVLPYCFLQLPLPPATMTFCLSLGSKPTWPRTVGGNLPKQSQIISPFKLFFPQVFGHNYI